MTSLFISNPVQVVEDRHTSEKLQGSKKPNTKYVLGYPIPNLRRRTSVAHNTWHSNDVCSLHDGSNNRHLRSNDLIVKCGNALHKDNRSSSQTRAYLLSRSS